MKELINNLKGDKVIWTFVALLALFSFMPVFSASSNLAYMNDGDGNTISYLLTHLAHIFMGFLIIYGVHKIIPIIILDPFQKLLCQLFGYYWPILWLKELLLLGQMQVAG
jgi:cell division protein FtsW (lipid II flippase)